MMPFVLALALTLAAPPQATGLKATIRVEVARVTPAGEPAPGTIAGLGAVLAQMLTPDGPVEMDWYADGEGVRATIRQRLSMLPAGAVVIQRAHAAAIDVLNPSEQTYFELTAGRGALDAGVPDLQIRPTGDAETIAGYRAERNELALTLALPAGAAGPAAGLPSDLQITGDVWLTSAFAGDRYGAILRTLNALMAIPGLEAALPAGRFPLRTRLRVAILPDIELRSEVRDIGRAAADPARLAIPAGFRRVDPPGRPPVR